MPAPKATDDEIIAFLKTGSKAAAAKHFDIDYRSFQRRCKRIALKGFSPEHDMTRTVPDGFKVKGVSSLYNKDGVLAAQWVKSSADDERRFELMVEAVEELKKDAKQVKIIPMAVSRNSDLLNVYTISDFHIGMLSWGEETGGDWDTDIAVQRLVSWFHASIQASPPAESCVFAQLGDFLHWDGMDAVTPASKHLLDADTRFSRLVRVAIRVLAEVTEMLAEKYTNVYVIHAEGNHDPASSVWLRETFAFRYEKTKGITVETRPDPYYCYEHGLTSLFWHHSHKHRMQGLDSVFASKFRAVFGRTKYSYGHTGHLHHKVVKETNLMILEQHPTLAEPDAYASRGGYMSQCNSSVITYHKDYGEVGRITISPDMLK